MTEETPRMRRDKDGSWTLAEPPHYCQGGWSGTDAQGRPRPCPRCKPHLARRRTVATFGEIPVR